MKEEARKVYLHNDLEDYILHLTEGVSQIEGVQAEISNRGVIAFVRACQCYAYLSNRDYIVPEDIKELAVPVLAHRLYFRNPMTTTKTKEEAIKELVARIDVPTEDWRK